MMLGDTALCVVSETPAIEDVGGLLTWTLDGGVATFLANSDTEAATIAHEAGYSTMEVTYESTGEHQGDATDQAACLIINVSIETSPAWVLSDTSPVECVADAQPSPAETGGTLTWALLDENDNPVNWATFDPSDCAAANARGAR